MRSDIHDWHARRYLRLRDEDAVIRTDSLLDILERTAMAKKDEAPPRLCDVRLPFAKSLERYQFAAIGMAGVLRVLMRCERVTPSILEEIQKALDQFEQA